MKKTLIAVSGKIGSGKDTVAEIIQILTYLDRVKLPFSMVAFNYNKVHATSKFHSEWQIKKFAGKLKEIIALLTGCKVEDLESQDFKNKELGKEWIRYIQHSHRRIVNAEPPYPHFGPEPMTYRLLLQEVGTEAMRECIHPNIWVNALFSDYKSIPRCSIWEDEHPNERGPYHHFSCEECKKPYDGFKMQPYCKDCAKKVDNPKWIITDCRFKNEAKAVKDHEGIIIRINRDTKSDSIHPSEIDLDDYKEFNYTIDNNGTMEQLIESVRTILIKENILKNG